MNDQKDHFPYTSIERRVSVEKKKIVVATFEQNNSL